MRLNPWNHISLLQVEGKKYSIKLFKDIVEMYHIVFISLIFKILFFLSGDVHIDIKEHYWHDVFSCVCVNSAKQDQSNSDL